MALFREQVSEISCVVVDLTMPVMSGEETLAQMRMLCPEIPIILSSGFNEIEALRQFEGKGLAGFLQKPYKADALAAKTKEVLGFLEGV